MIGYVQGLQSIVDAVSNIILQVAYITPNVGAAIGSAVAGFMEQLINPDYGSYWAFGVILAVGGFILVARGDPKPRPA